MVEEYEEIVDPLERPDDQDDDLGEKSSCVFLFIEYLLHNMHFGPFVSQGNYRAMSYVLNDSRSLM